MYTILKLYNKTEEFFICVYIRDNLWIQKIFFVHDSQVTFHMHRLLFMYSEKKILFPVHRKIILYILVPRERNR